MFAATIEREADVLSGRSAAETIQVGRQIGGSTSSVMVNREPRLKLALSTPDGVAGIVVRPAMENCAAG